MADATLIVQPDRAKVQRAAEEEREGADGGVDPEPEPGPGPGPESPGKTRFFGSKTLQPDRDASDSKKLADEVLGPPVRRPAWR